MRWEVVDDRPTISCDGPRLHPDLQRVLENALSTTLRGQLLAPTVSAQVWDVVHDVLASRPGVNGDEIRFRTVQIRNSGEILIEPSNLYTGCLLAGHVLTAAGLQYNWDDEVTFPE